LLKVKRLGGKDIAERVSQFFKQAVNIQHFLPGERTKPIFFLINFTLRKK